MSFEEWLQMKRTESIQFNYWLTAMEMEALLLKLIRSLREADFHMFIEALDVLFRSHPLCPMDVHFHPRHENAAREAFCCI